jgi:rhodanese-related sulfurtransferase
MKQIFARMAAPILGLAFALAAAPALAQHTPEKLAGVKVVTAEEVERLMLTGVPVIDTRVANEYAEEHVKGAKSVPYKEKSPKAVDFDSKLDSFDVSKLPADKAAPVVLYCNAGECWKSYKASVVASRAGYTDIRWFRGGMPEWKTKKLPTE